MDSKIYCTATVLATKKEFPKFGEAWIKALKWGEHIATQVTPKNVQCFVWKDRKPVYFVNTICDYNTMGVVARKLGDGSSIDVSCPTAVKLYNQNMGGVDLADQLRGAYTCSTRKSRTRWYMRLFWFFLDLSIVNAYILESVSPNHVPPIAKTEKAI